MLWSFFLSFIFFCHMHEYTELPSFYDIERTIYAMHKRCHFFSLSLYVSSRKYSISFFYYKNTNDNIIWMHCWQDKAREKEKERENIHFLHHIHYIYDENFSILKTHFRSVRFFFCKKYIPQI